MDELPKWLIEFTYYQLGVVSSLQYLRDPSDLGFTMGVTVGGMVTVLSAVRPCGRRVLPRGP
jgi:hypothetical protein